MICNVWKCSMVWYLVTSTERLYSAAGESSIAWRKSVIITLRGRRSCEKKDQGPVLRKAKIWEQVNRPKAMGTLVVTSKRQTRRISTWGEREVEPFSPAGTQIGPQLKQWILAKQVSEACTAYCQHQIWWREVVQNCKSELEPPVLQGHFRTHYSLAFT